MLEDGHDEHVKSYDRVQKWHGAAASHKQVQQKYRQMDKLQSEMGRAIAYERQLALIGVQKVNVKNGIYGKQIGATHNMHQSGIKKQVARCSDAHCQMSGRNQNPGQENCQECGSPMQAVQVPYQPNELRDKYGGYMFGVELKDGTIKWFKEPVAPNFWYHTYGETVD